MNKEISFDNLAKYRQDFNSSRTNKVAANAVGHNGVLTSAYNSEEAFKLTPVFNVEIKDMPSVTYQKQTGRCWMFASLNIIRPALVQNLGVKDLELSENYLFFYDKLEKSNLKLQLVIDNIDEPDDSRVWDVLGRLGGGMDGGYWHYFANLVKKYGVVPKSVMGETVSSSSSKEMDSVLTLLLGKDAAELKRQYKDGATKEQLVGLKNVMLNEVYRVLGICLGLPPEEFTFEYRKDNEEKEFVRIETTPQKFYEEYIGINLDDYVVCANHNNPDYPFYTKYMSEFAINMANQEYEILNLPMEELKETAIKCLQDNQPAFFACDVSAYSIRQEGLLSRKVINIDDLFDIDFNFDKFERVKERASYWNHAMTLTGVNLDDEGKPNRWKIQNSWGTDVGTNGIFICDDDWFDEYVYQVLVNKKYLSQKALEALDGETKVLKHWEIIA